MLEETNNLDKRVRLLELGQARCDAEWKAFQKTYTEDHKHIEELMTWKNKALGGMAAIAAICSFVGAVLGAWLR